MKVKTRIVKMEKEFLNKKMRKQEMIISKNQQKKTKIKK